MWSFELPLEWWKVGDSFENLCVVDGVVTNMNVSARPQVIGARRIKPRAH